MDLLKKDIQKNGFLYNLYKRGEKAMIYSQTHPEDTEPLAYEVFKIKIDKPKIVFGNPLPEREKFPGNEDFGKWAWTYRTLDEAKVKFYNLEESDE